MQKTGVKATLSSKTSKSLMLLNPNLCFKEGSESSSLYPCKVKIPWYDPRKISCQEKY